MKANPALDLSAGGDQSNTALPETPVVAFALAVVVAVSATLA